MSDSNKTRAHLGRREFVALSALGAAAAIPRSARAVTPSGQLRMGVHVSLAPTWFDPAETPGIITPFLMLYALHDAMLKPMPGQSPAPSLAESWSATEDGLAYDFVLRKGVTFHNGEPVTAEDVKFSFERYRGADHTAIKARVVSVETPSPQRVRFNLKTPWPDFVTYYSLTTGAGWIVPKKYVEKIGEDAFKKAPIGAGPYKFVSFTPGVELVLEAYEAYWRKTPSIKRIVMRVIPDESTRLAALTAGEIDIALSIRGELADQIRRTSGLALNPAVSSAPFWVYFPEQWDPKSPWHDQRVRRAASLAINRDAINQALTLGFSQLTGSLFPDNFEFYWKPPATGVRCGRGQASARGCRIQQRFRRRVLHLRRFLREPGRGGAYKPLSCRHSREVATAGTSGVHPGLRRPEVQEHRPGGGAVPSATWPHVSKRSW